MPETSFAHVLAAMLLTYLHLDGYCDRVRKAAGARVLLPMALLFFSYLCPCIWHCVNAKSETDCLAC